MINEVGTVLRYVQYNKSGPHPLQLTDSLELPFLPNLKTLTLNKNHINRLDRFVAIVKTQWFAVI